ncbi:MAG: hypothetical protein ACR2JU_10620 [Nocardioidaceae bacterium]
MTAERPWARHYHEAWQERAGDDRLPYWLRVAALAYGSHLDNGHARFKRGEIALVLGKVDSITGEVMSFENVTRAIETAVTYGWLEPESFWGCLVVPAHAIKKGEHGRKPSCPIHAKRRREGKETAAQQARTLHSVTGSGVSNRHSVTASGGRTPHSVTGSERGPLSSLLPNLDHRTPATRGEAAN